MLVSAFGLFQWALLNERSIEEARTIATNVFVMIETAYLLNCRALDHKLVRTEKTRTTPWMKADVALMVSLQIGLTYHPLANAVFKTAPIKLADWGLILIAAAMTFAVVEGEKALYRHRQRN